MGYSVKKKGNIKMNNVNDKILEEKPEKIKNNGKRNGWVFYDDGLEYEAKRYFIGYKTLLDDVDESNNKSYTFLRHICKKSWCSLATFWPVYTRVLKNHNITINKRMMDDYFIVAEEEKTRIERMFYSTVYDWHVEKPYSDLHGIRGSTLLSIDRQALAKKWIKNNIVN